MVDLVLDYLRGKSRECLEAFLKFIVLELYLNALVTRNGTGFSEERQTSLGCLVRSRFFHNFGVEHNLVNPRIRVTLSAVEEYAKIPRDDSFITGDFFILRMPILYLYYHHQLLFGQSKKKEFDAFPPYQPNPTAKQNVKANPQYQLHYNPF